MFLMLQLHLFLYPSTITKRLYIYIMCVLATYIHIMCVVQVVVDILFIEHKHAFVYTICGQWMWPLALGSLVEVYCCCCETKRAMHRCRKLTNNKPKQIRYSVV